MSAKELNISKNVDFIAEKPQKFHEIRAVSPFALFAQSQSLKSLLILHFSIFLLEILKLASQLNLAAILSTEFLNFEFGPILAHFLAGKTDLIRIQFFRICSWRFCNWSEFVNEVEKVYGIKYVLQYSKML